MILSDTAIRQAIEDGDIVIDPIPHDDAFQPASIDLRLSSDLLVYPKTLIGIDLENPIKKERFDTPFEDSPLLDCLLAPDEFALGSTMESIAISPKFYARVDGKSSLGRYGLMVHVTAGFIDPGFSGNITLELKNLNRCPILLHAGMPIAQICFGRVDGHVERPYGSKELGSKYQGSIGTVGPRRAK